MASDRAATWTARLARRHGGAVLNEGSPAPSSLTSKFDRWMPDKHTCQVRNDVRQRRESTSMSQGELAAALGVSRQTINSIEVGRYTPSLPLALRLAAFFQVSVEELFADD